MQKQSKTGSEEFSDRNNLTISTLRFKKSLKINGTRTAVVLGERVISQVMKVKISLNECLQSSDHEKVKAICLFKFDS
jgi:hypothetical protein